MYSVVLLAAMTATTEAPSFGSHYGSSFWSNHCFWEDCWPARYGWTCVPGSGGYYPAPVGSCHGYWNSGYSSCNGCYSSCHGCYSSCHGCYSSCQGYAPYQGCYSTCHGCYAYSAYGCYGGYGGFGQGYGGFGPGYGGYGPDHAIGYGNFSGYGNFGYFGAFPVTPPPTYGAPASTPVEIRSLEVRPTEIKPIEIKPIPKTLNMVPPANTATIVVNVSANAKVYIDDHLMKSTATERTFVSPELELGQSYYYMVRVVAEVDGNSVEEVKKVRVQAGERSLLAFEKIPESKRPDRRTYVESELNRNR